LKHIDESPRFILEVFVVTNWQGSIRNVNQSEHETVSWFTVEEALKLTLADERYKDLFRLLEETCPF
jgi:hypothetical protein